MEGLDFTKLPNDEWIQNNPDGSRFIPIGTIEDMLDSLKWGTRNFHYTLFKDGYANITIAASIELVIDDNGKERSFVGAANVSIKSIEPNFHYLATVKSECVKNAASDIGKYFGRHINDGIEIKLPETSIAKAAKLKPDSKILKQFLKAVEEKDEATITMLTNIYELKTE